MARALIRAVVVAALVVSVGAPAARGHGESIQYTSFATFDVQPPLITGTVWLELSAMEKRFGGDRDGDGQYTDAELRGMRRAIRGYLAERLLVMWQGQIHPFEVNAITVATRPGVGPKLLRVGFTLRDLPPGAPFSIASRLLHDFAPKARCMALIEHGGRTEIAVLGPRDYYQSSPWTPPCQVGSAYRPRSERGRIVVTRDLYLEMLYATPEGAFYLYILGEDRETPHGIEAKSITALIHPKEKVGMRTSIELTARPLSSDVDGSCSRFVGTALQFKQADADLFSADMAFGSGADRRRMILEFPTVAVSSEPTPASRRYACARLCLGVASKDSSARCMRCGSKLLEAHGAAVPGVGLIGRHGAPMQRIDASGIIVEAQVPYPNELRLHLTNEAMEPLSIEGVKGVATLWNSLEHQPSDPGITLKLEKVGAFFSLQLPEGVTLPFVAACALDFGGVRPPGSATFTLHEVVAPVELTPQPLPHG